MYQFKKTCRKCGKEPLAKTHRSLSDKFLQLILPHYRQRQKLICIACGHKGFYKIENPEDEIFI